ncbi:hypothetical protein LTR08_001367 [Meristemomyces frigidus]|nr:hypothetical protein LTR08_001367 [Meristemomyces frigidus]
MGSWSQNQSYLEPDFSARKDSPLLYTEVAASSRQHRKSVRIRPLHVLENYHAEPLSPMKDSMAHPQLQQRASKMSLFSLFSRPKVEKARGYAEQGLVSPLPYDPSTSRLELPVHVDPSYDTSYDTGYALPRPGSAMSFRNARVATKSKMKVAGSQLAMSTRKAEAWEPPPLFQAFPQSMKHGSLEVSTMTADVVLQKSKSRKPGALYVPSVEATPRGSVEDKASMDTKRSTKIGMRHVATGSVGHVDLPKKIIILVTSGHLLQYAESGPSDRLPERALELGKDSAAFACDLIPGQHYVLQISQAVDRSGVVIANTGSIFSKLGLRSATAKRTTSNLLLVMPNAAEMDKWMVAVREEIEMLGGKKARADSIRRQASETADRQSELEAISGRGLRYHSERDPGRVSVGDVASGEDLDSLPLPPRFIDDDERSETCTIDGIEEEAEQLVLEARMFPAKLPRELDAQSVSSSIAISEQHRRLSSLRDSNRMSHATVATTVATSRTNSLSGSPPSDQSLKGSSETSRDAVPTKSSYRSLSSYAFSRRRSAMPMPTRESPVPPIDVSAQPPTDSSSANPPDSPVAGRNSPFPLSVTSPRKLVVASSEPNLRAVATDVRAKHDSRMPSPRMLSTEEPADRPLSIIGDLPSIATLAGERAPKMRLPWGQTTAAPAFHAQRMMPRVTRMSEPSKPARHQTQPFMLPLKINPSSPANRPPTREGDDGTFEMTEESAGEPIVHTLTAKIDPLCPLSGSPITPPLPSPKQDVPLKQPSRTSSGRLSLFPAQTALPLIIPQPGIDYLKRPPSVASTPTYTQALANGPALRRPISMQVRSDHAPFLRSVRSSNIGGLTVNTARSFTAPIRSLKPSRSSTYMTASRSVQPSPTDPFHTVGASAFGTVALPEDVTSLPDRGALPSPSWVRPPSRARAERKTMTPSSLPELDLGIPVVGLGPPAPPPQAPLPAPPPASRPTSPMPMNYGMAGLGIRV